MNKKQKAYLRECSIKADIGTEIDNLADCIDIGKKFYLLVDNLYKLFNKHRDKEIVICSAIKLRGLIIRGHRHCDCYHNLSLRPKGKELLLKYGERIIDGFITSKNIFVGREEARFIQELAGIKSADKDGYRGDILYSEDLY